MSLRTGYSSEWTRPAAFVSQTLGVGNTKVWFGEGRNVQSNLFVFFFRCLWAASTIIILMTVRL